jgi:hypothetical protein
MKMILAFLLTALVVPSMLSSVQNQKGVGPSGWSANVRSELKHEGMCSAGLPLNKPSIRSVSTAPNCGIYVAQLTERWADPKVTPRAPTGGLVSGFRFSGWMENGKAKVMVWALVNDKDSTSASYDEKKLTGQLVDTFLIEPGSSVVIDELRQYGAKPIELSITRTK